MSSLLLCLVLFFKYINEKRKKDRVLVAGTEVKVKFRGGQLTYRVAEVRRLPAGAAGCVFPETGASCGRCVSPWLGTVLWLGNQTRLSSDIVCKRKCLLLLF